MHSSSRKSSCFIGDEEDYDVQSSTTTNTNTSSSSSSISIPSPPHRSYINLRSFNGRLYEPRYDNRQSHFLQTCAFCSKSISDHMDIFIGDTPFCSDECRQEQIDIDDANDKKLKMSSGVSMNKTMSANQAQKYLIRTSTVAAA